MSLTANDKTDGGQLPELLKQIKEPVSRVVMLDGAYDTTECWDNILEMGYNPSYRPEKMPGYGMRTNREIWNITLVKWL